MNLIKLQKCVVNHEEYLRKLVRILNEKEKYSPDRDAFDYYGIRDIEIYLMMLVKKIITNQY